jgi:magnesium-transporting ATPase (P-type)
MAELANEGMRVIALAYRTFEKSSKLVNLCCVCCFVLMSFIMFLIQADIVAQPRAFVEQQLQFAGFIAFKCLVRRDSAAVIKVKYQSNPFICWF